MQRRYLTSFLFLALVPLGGWLGGAWTFMAAAMTPLALVCLDAGLGDEDPRHPSRLGVRLDWLPRIYVLVQLGVTAWAVAWAVRPGTSFAEAAGLALSCGMTTGVFGFVTAHEMIHSRNPWERGLGVLALGSVFYMHFRISHIYGHHRRAATPDDPASARLGEGLYAFVARSVVGQVREAWAFEARRLKRTRGHNRVVAYLAIEAAFLILLLLISWRAAAFVIAVAVVAVGLLETFNYVAHYGLSRAVDEDGHVERLAPRHSWNTARRMNNAALFNMGRHSDHHRHPAHSYAQLEPLHGEAELPFGYAGALLTALVPPLWRRIMDDRAAKANQSPSI